jgi:very-short-patch-repair endonuclease
VSVDDRLVGFARENRKDSTRAERILWRELRGGALGVRFRRQDPIGPFIADSACRDRRLVIETDGNSHTIVEKDYLRDRWFIDNEWTVLRFTDDEDVGSTQFVIDLICAVLEDPSKAVEELGFTYETRWGFGSPIESEGHRPLPSGGGDPSAFES